MSFTDHLGELRTSLIRVIIILLTGFVVCYAFGAQITDVLLMPLQESLGGEGKVIFTGILDKVLAHFQLSFWSSVIFTSPLWFFVIWGFVKPALLEDEAKLIRPFMIAGFGLFSLGVCFGYFILFPFTFDTLLTFGVQDIGAYIDLKDYLILSCKVLIFLGILFQLPNVMLILGFMGLVTKQSLSQVRPFVLTAFAVVSATVTPPDVITLMCVWIPLVLLYEIGIVGVGIIVHPYFRKKYLGK